MAALAARRAFFTFPSFEEENDAPVDLDSTRRLRGPALDRYRVHLTTTGNEPSDRLGRYRLDRLLGRGGMAEVFTAVHSGAADFQRRVCLKRILPQLAMDLEFRELFMREAKVAGRLCHANLVQVFDCIEECDNLAIVMEMVDGMDLRELVKTLGLHRRVVPEKIVAYVAGQLLEGLRYAHESQVIHRDISPHNVLVSRHGEVKLADFGVAKAMLTQATRTGNLKGKLAYMSPEQASGDQVDHRTDLYSTGLVLYELITGERYFPQLSHSELMGHVISAPQPHIEGVDRLLARVVERLLAPQVSDRFQTAREALSELPAWDTIGPAGAVELSDLVRRLKNGEEAGAVAPSFITGDGTHIVSGVRPAEAAPIHPVLPAAGDAVTVTRSRVEAQLDLALAKTDELDDLSALSEAARLAPDTIEDAVFTDTQTGLLALGRERRSWTRCSIPARSRAGRGMTSTRWISAAAILSLVVGLALGVAGRLYLTPAEPEPTNRSLVENGLENGVENDGTDQFEK